MLKYFLALCMALLAFGADASGKAAVLFQNEDVLAVPCAQSEPASGTWKFPAVPAKQGYTPVLVFDGGIDFKFPRGWSYMTRLAVNGRHLNGFMPDNAVRLLNRGDYLVSTVEKKRPWWSGSRLMTMYGPVAKGELHRGVTSPRKEGYTYRIAVGDVVRPDKENTLEVTNFLTEKVMKSAKGAALKLLNLRIEMVPDEEVEKMRSFDPVSRFIAEAAREEAAFRAKQELRINCLPDSPSSLDVKFPAIGKKPGMAVVLAFDAWLYSPSPAGWNAFLQMNLNGKAVTRYNNAGAERLLRRGDRMVTTFPKQPIRPWWEGNTLLMLFGPGRGPLGDRIVSPRDEGYTYYFDITDLVNSIVYGPDNRIESAMENTLNIVNNLNRKHLHGKSSYMGLRNLRVIYLPESTVAHYRGERMTGWENVKSGISSISADGTTVKIAPAGGIELANSNGVFRIDTFFSYPAQPKMRFNNFNFSAGAEGEKSWKPAVSADGKTVTVKASGTNYSVQRTVTLSGGVIRLADRITNTSKSDIGIKYLLRLTEKEKIANENICLGGVENITYSDGIGDNPTVFIAGKKAGLGVMAYDDVFRNHLKAMKSGANSVDMTDENSALKPGESYEWVSLVILTDKPDYFAFLNALRKKLGRSQTIPFSFGFSEVTGGDFNFTLFAPEPWFEWTIRGAKLYTRQEYAELLAGKKAKLREKFPGARIIARMETNITVIDKSKIAGGDKLPPSLVIDSQGNRRYGTYGHICSPEQTGILLKNSLFADSLLFTADNRAMVDGYYSAEPRLNLLVQVEEGNYRYKNILEQIEFLTGPAGLDGVYMDQFEAGCTGAITRSDRCSYNRWDGRSVDLDEAGNIARKFYDYAIAGTSGRVNIIKSVTDKGKIFFTNNHPVSEKTAQLPAYHFHEMEFMPLHSDTWNLTGEPRSLYILGKCQLSNTPLTLGIRPGFYTKERSKYGEYIQKAVIVALRHGVLYCLYHSDIGSDKPGILNYTYPITPLELGKGFIIGKERILTAVSGEFLTDTKPVEIKRFNLRGEELPSGAKIEKSGSQWKVNIKLKEWNETAVIILDGKK